MERVWGDAREMGAENDDEFGSTHGSHIKQTVDKQIDISFSNANMDYFEETKKIMVISFFIF